MSDQVASKKKTPRIWHEKHQSVLKSWGESAACYRYMHFKAYESFKSKNMLFTLPIIVIGTVTGTANFAQSTFPKDIQPFVPSIIGALNLFSAILTTVAQFLKIAELMESHRVSYINYGKLARHIKLEINLPVSERNHHGANMIDMCGAEYDRLIEQCPPVPKKIMTKFVLTFPESDDEKKNLKFTRPEVFSVTPFDEYPFDKNSQKVEKKTFFSPTVKWSSGRKDLLKELEDLNKQSKVTSNSVIVDIIPSHPANLDLNEGSEEQSSSSVISEE